MPKNSTNNTNIPPINKPRKPAEDNLNIKKDERKSTSIYKEAHNVEGLKKHLVEAYYNLEEDIYIRSNFSITASQIIEILGDKRVFIFNNSFTCSTSQGYKTDIKVKLTYTQGFKVFRAILNPSLISKLNQLEIKVYRKINEIFNKIIKPGMSDFEKQVKVHDYLILTSRYDYENYINNTIPELSYTPYGLLFHNKAVCSAYAEVFMIFMTLANIECYYVTGTTKDINGASLNAGNNLGHAWNIVRINNQYYHIDVTFDNPVPDVIGRVNYKYFNVSDSVIGRTHNWKKEDYPSCFAKEHNYYNAVSKSRR